MSMLLFSNANVLYVYLRACMLGYTCTNKSRYWCHLAPVLNYFISQIAIARV